MLERINNIDYRYRIEDDNTLLAFNVITFEMTFLKGLTKDYIIKLLNNEEYNGTISDKNMNILKNKKIII